MERLASIKEFEKLRKQAVKKYASSLPVIIINAGTCGQASGANDLIRISKRLLLEKGLADKVALRVTGCHGFCEMEPSVLVEPDRTFYPKIDIDAMERIIDAVINGDVIEELLYEDPESGKKIRCQDDIPFFKKQVRTLLGSSEKIDPIRIYDYIANDGYTALIKALSNGESEAIIEEVTDSGLRGRGGAGFPAGIKWRMLAEQRNGSGKFIICNADEGDPGAYMDRSLLEGNPQSIIEGMLIGAYATGANSGIVYVRNEYPLAIKHLVIALDQARALGLLGENILGSDFSFDIDIVRGAGAFVCGEETALIKSIEGKMGEPRQRPPYPVEKGVDGKPTVINNVETWANVPVIIREGSANYAKVGTKTSKGTKIFSLVGKVKNTGLVEVPMGITISEIVYVVGGGSSGKIDVKAVQTGGPSGGCIPASMFDLPIDYDSLAEVGSIMGSGGLIIMDEDTCIVDIAKYFMGFLKNESCGKCFTCRKGTQRMYEILDDITKGLGTLEDLDLLEELAHAVQDTTMCGLGQSASNPVLSTLKYFRNEYERHIVDKRCDAFVCTDLVGAPCQSACPVGTEAWRYIALIEKGEYDDAYDVIRAHNTFPSVCARVCNHPCEEKCKLGTMGDKPVAIRSLKRFVTDYVDKSVFQQQPLVKAEKESPRVAVVGAGPAGLTAAHHLSLNGYGVSLFEAADRLGGMLVSAIPDYRLPRDVLQQEIDALLNENITVNLNSSLGTDITVDGLLGDGYNAVFLALGAQESISLGIDGEDSEGVYPSIEFLKAYNLKGENVAKGRVGVIGGGNSAIDAARIAIRQEGVSDVTILYRRTRNEMPAYEEEIEGALEEGITLKILVSPEEIESKNGRLSGVKFIMNELGKRDASGRKRPVPLPGSEFVEPLDTLIVAISEQPDTKSIDGTDIATTKWNSIITDSKTMATGIKGVFAGGDVVRGPNTVIEAIADGKRAASVIDRYIRGESLSIPATIEIAEYFIAPADVVEGEPEVIERAKNPMTSIEARLENPSVEVELSLREEDAIRETRRCLRCDLEFTQLEEEPEELIAIGEK